LPVPVSPVTSTLHAVGAMRSTCARTRRNPGDRPTIEAAEGATTEELRGTTRRNRVCGAGLTPSARPPALVKTHERAPPRAFGAV
jgi:hypothetical protein